MSITPENRGMSADDVDELDDDAANDDDEEEDDEDADAGDDVVTN